MKSSAGYEGRASAGHRGDRTGQLHQFFVGQRHEVGRAVGRPEKPNAAVNETVDPPASGCEVKRLIRAKRRHDWHQWSAQPRNDSLIIAARKIGGQIQKGLS